MSSFIFCTSILLVNGFLPPLRTKAAPSSAALTEAMEVYRKNFPENKFGSDISSAQTAFKELVRLYGEEQALEMTKNLPNCLRFKVNNFAPTLEGFIKVFGEEEAKAMINRNPGLLSQRAEFVERADDTTMKMSYVVAYTRPYGPVLQAGLALLLSLPALEKITGLPLLVWVQR